MGNILNPYKLSIILHKSALLTYLGKLVWALKTSPSSDERLNQIDLVMSVISREGKPLTSQRIRECMKSYRGLSRNMQLNPNGELIRISAKEWGLASRDLDCSREVIDDALDCIQAHLEQHTKALHLSEIVPVIEDWGLTCKDSNLSYPIFSFCQTDTRFKSWQGGLVGLSSWSEPNRHTVTSAVKTILTPNLNSITLEQFHSQLEDKVGRRVEKSLLSGILSNSELVYDSKLRIWVRQTPDDLED